MLCDFYRLVRVCHVIKLLECDKLLSGKRGSVKGKDNLNLHILTVSRKGIIIFHTFAVNDQLRIFVLYHLPAFEPVSRTNFQPTKSDGIHDRHLFTGSDFLFTVRTCRRCVDFNYPLGNKYGLSLVVNVLMFRYLYRLVRVRHVVEFLESHQIFPGKGRSIKGKGYLNLHLLFICGKGVITLHRLAVNEQLGVFIFYHLPAFELVLCTDFQPI